MEVFDRWLKVNAGDIVANDRKRDRRGERRPPSLDPTMQLYPDRHYFIAATLR